MLGVLTLLACHGVHETGPAGMVGRVVDADGRPVSGLVVETLEAKEVTDAQGAFAIAWKDARYVHFRSGGAWYRRSVLPEDDGTVVTVQLPPVHTVGVRCPRHDCTLDLSWDCGAGLRAEASVSCAAGETRDLVAVPATSPAMRCRERPDDVVSGAIVTRDDGRAVLDLAPVVVTQLRIAALPEQCTVTVGDQVAQPVPSGMWLVSLREPGWARAVCQGRPSVPVRVEPGSATELSWSIQGPDLRLGAAHAGVRALQLVSSDWSLPIGSTDGVFRLPDLPAGTYRVLASGPDGPTAEALAAQPPTPSRPGVLALAGEGPGLVGIIEVPADGLDAAVPTE